MFILLSLLTHATSDKTKSSQVKVVYSKITTFNQLGVFLILVNIQTHTVFFTVAVFSVLYLMLG